MEKYTVEWHYEGFDYVFHTLDTLFYGVVGIWVAHTIGAEKVAMSDVNVAALEMAAENVKVNNLDEIQIIQSNGFDNIYDVDFTLILSNPPYHTDLSVAKAFIEGSYKHLKIGGWLVMVTKRFDWYKNKIYVSDE